MREVDGLLVVQVIAALPPKEGEADTIEITGGVGSMVVKLAGDAAVTGDVELPPELSTDVTRK